MVCSAGGGGGRPPEVSGQSKRCLRRLLRHRNWCARVLHQRADRSTASVVKKLTRHCRRSGVHFELEATPARGPRPGRRLGCRLTLSDRFYTPTLIRPDNERGRRRMSFKSSAAMSEHKDPKKTPLVAQRLLLFQ